MMNTLKCVGLGILLAGTAVLLIACRSDHEFVGTVPTEIQPVPDFTLSGIDGPVSLSGFEDKYVFIYFGYTFCPDVCPDTLSKLARVRRRLSAEDADQVQVIMISVDPDRDTPELLAEYVKHFDDSFIGLTGTKEEIDEAGKPYYLFYEKHDGTVASGYLIDHSSRTFLIDKNGNARLSYSFDTPADGILSDLEWLISHE